MTPEAQAELLLVAATLEVSPTQVIRNLSETKVHKAADAYYSKVLTIVKWSFTKGRQAVDKTKLRAALATGDRPKALAAIRHAGDEVEKALESKLAPLYIRILEAGGNAGLDILYKQRVLTTLAIKIRFDVSNPKAVKWAKDNAGKRIEGISQTTRERIASAVSDALESGSPSDAYDDILDAIGDDVRADRIAQTETMSAANEGQREAWDQAIDRGFLSEDSERVWIAAPDCCPLCNELDGETAGLNESYPADGGDGPPLHPNCRCTEGLTGN